MESTLLERVRALGLMSKYDRRAHFDKHVAAGTCGLCDKPVADGDAVYTITGVHWECHRQCTSPNDAKRDTAPDAPRAGHILARAAGGHLMHTVDVATGLALCGQALTHTAKRMRRRSRWFRYDRMPDGHPRCSTCEAIAPLQIDAKDRIVDARESADAERERIERAHLAWSKSAKEKWRWDCAGHIRTNVDGEEVVLANFEGCQDDAAAVCRLHNNASVLFALALGYQPNPPFDAARLARAYDAWRRATAGRWHWDCAGDVLAYVGGTEVVIGSFQGSETEAAAACKLHNAAETLFRLAGIAR